MVQMFIQEDIEKFKQNYPDVDIFDLFENGFDKLTRVSLDALKEEELDEIQNSEEEWD